MLLALALAAIIIVAATAGALLAFSHASSSSPTSYSTSYISSVQTFTITKTITTTAIIRSTSYNSSRDSTTSMQSSSTSNINKTGIIVPLYTPPSDPSWINLINDKTSHPNIPIIAIINPSNGPGASKNGQYSLGIAELRYNNIIVLGYVYTGYGSRSVFSVESDISNYKNWYNVSGIFFDEMAFTSGHESYYATLSSYAKSLGMNFTVGNPGIDLPLSYYGIFNIVNVYESRGYPSSQQFSTIWYSNLPSKGFSIIVTGVNSLNQSFVKSIAGRVGYVYITNASDPNPFNALSPFILEISKILDNQG